MAAHGYFDYGRISEIADEIQREFLNDGKYRVEGEKKEYDRIGDATKDEREEILDEIMDLILSLKYNAARVRELEWYLSGDIKSSGYLERKKKIWECHTLLIKNDIN